MYNICTLLVKTNLSYVGTFTVAQDPTNNKIVV